MKRYLHDEITRDLAKKMVFVTGPRQVGKTTLAKALMAGFKRPLYLNQDDINDARIIQGRSWPLDSGLVVFDEIHKATEWKSFLKGTFDTRADGQAFLVTGSARLDTFRQAGDSLAGRYFQHRLHPLSVKELSTDMKPFEAVAALNQLGGFPEPLLGASDEQASRWRRQYYGDLVREDIMDFSRIHEIRAIRLLLEMLRSRVCSPISYASLARDLQLAPNTVRKYVDILESLHIIFLVRPFHTNVARSILKEPKAYFFDSGYVEGGEGARLENTAAACLLKHVHYLQDSKGQDIDLHYLRTKEGKEADFALTRGGNLEMIIEIKLSDPSPSPNLEFFLHQFPQARALQLVHHLRRDEESKGIRTAMAGEWLAQLAA